MPADPPGSEPPPETPREPPPARPYPTDDKGFSPETSGAHDTGQPAGVAGAEEPPAEAAEFNWGCIALIALLFLVGAVAWWISGG